MAAALVSYQMSRSVVCSLGGAVWAWGAGAVGQLGQGTRIPQAPSPLLVPDFRVGPDGSGSTTAHPPVVTGIAAGALHSVLVTGEEGLTAHASSLQ